MSASVGDARRNQALAEVDSLTRELDAWYAEWKTFDTHLDGSPRGQYTSQLDAVYSEVHATATIIRGELVNLSVSGDIGTTYGKCALIERQIIWLWRVWYFFRDKFEQRKDPRFSSVLRAADEVVWSCYRPFFQLPSLKMLRQPAPLPYLEPDFSPSALRRDQKQVLTRKDRDFALVREAFQELPVPILKIPITASNNPWALVLIGHETGHIVEPLLEDGFNETFRNTIRGAIDSAQGSEEDQEAWGGWAEEIFADLYSVLTMGPWAVWAMAQFETAETPIMTERRFVYPSPAVRLALLTAFAQRYALRLDNPVAVNAAEPEFQRDLGYVQGVAGAITAMPQIQALAGALPFLKSAYDRKKPDGTAGEVEQWSNHLLGKGNSPASNALRSARMIAAGSAQAWYEAFFAGAGNFPATALENLREITLVKIRGSFAPGVRSAAAAPARRRAPGAALFEALQQADAISN